MKPETNAPRLSITRVARRTACPICAALREFQSELVEQLGPNECRRFCNTHGWLVANSAPADSAAGIFLNAIENPDWEQGSAVPEECDICRKVQAEKEDRLKEIAVQLRQSRLRTWLHDYGVLCSRHGREIIAKLPENLRESIQEVLTRNSREIVELLEEFLRRAETGSHVGGGVLGRAAEFLVAQRGIER